MFKTCIVSTIGSSNFELKLEIQNAFFFIHCFDSTVLCSGEYIRYILIFHHKIYRDESFANFIAE